MAQPKTKKRRSTSKRKASSKSSAKTKGAETRIGWFASQSSPRWFFEILAVVGGVVALFSAASVLSHQFSLAPLPLDVNEEIGSRAVSNIMGPVGDIVGTILVGFMGWCAIVPSFWAGIISLYFHFKVAGDDLSEKYVIDSKPLFVVGVVGTLISCCGIAGVFGGAPAGGIIGTTIAEPLLKLFNLPGAVLVSTALLLLFLAFALQRSSGVILAQVLVLLLTAARFIFVTIPFALFYLSADVVLLASRSIGEALKAAFPVEDSEIEHEVEIADEPMPKPKRRKNKITPEVEKVEEEVDFADEVVESEEEPMTHVVVKRREQQVPTATSLRQRQLREPERFKRDSARDRAYVTPDLELLQRGEASSTGDDDETLRKKSRLIEGKLRDFGIKGHVTEVHPGPVITLFEFEPAPGVKVGKIASLQDDLAMSLRATSIRIIAPIPRKGTVGIEVPNKQCDIVRLRDLLESDAFLNGDSTLSIAIGKDTYGDPVVVDVAKMPHLLMAGATGTGKSVCINTLLLSLLYRASPADLGLILIDPKILELSVYEGIPHLRVPVVTVPRQAKAVLEWAVKEMDRRYRTMQKYGVRSIDGYNAMVRGDEEGAERTTRIKPKGVVELEESSIVEEGTAAPTEDTQAADSEGDEKVHRIVEEMEPMSKVVIVIDELADLMLSVGREIEDLIARLAQKARAAGIHLIVATQRPSVDVITGLIKANFPARLSFRVSSRIDSRTILDAMGAEKLLGRGDMLFREPGGQHARRIHGAFVADAEVRNVVHSLKSSEGPQYDREIMAACEKALEEESSGGQLEMAGGAEYDAFYDKAVALVIEKGQASTSMIQRAFRIGYNRAARMIDVMEQEGVIGPMDGAKPRAVLVASMDLQEPNT